MVDGGKVNGWNGCGGWGRVDCGMVDFGLWDGGWWMVDDALCDAGWWMVVAGGYWTCTTL